MQYLYQRPLILTYICSNSLLQLIVARENAIIEMIAKQK